MYATAELGEGENPELNIASLKKNGIVVKHLQRRPFEVVSSMVKAILLKVYLLLPSSVGVYH